MSSCRLRFFRFVTIFVAFGLTGLLGGQLSGAAPAHHQIEASVTAETKALLWMPMAPAEESASVASCPLREAWPAPSGTFVNGPGALPVGAASRALAGASFRHGPTSLVGVVELRL